MKLIFIPLIILSMFGIVFIGLLTHEFVHIIQTPVPMSICYDYNQISIMSTSFDRNNLCSGINSDHMLCDEDSFNRFTLYTEKWALIIGLIIIVVISMLVGMIIGKWQHNI